LAGARHNQIFYDNWAAVGKSHVKLRTVFLVFCIVAFAIGCGGSPRRTVHTEFHPFTEEEQKLWDDAAEARYRLKVGDTFAVDFKYQDELDRNDIVILPDGRFTMSGVEDVRAAGMTIPELDTLLTDHFKQEYRNPELAVIIQKLGPQPVYVLGEVGSPGTYDIPETGCGILQAIAMAGGFSEHAQSSQTLLVRVKDGGYFYQIFDMSHLEKWGIAGVDHLFVQPNDIIYVPRSTLGDLDYFSSTVLSAALKTSQLFWNIWAITRLNQVRIVQ
jgi:protein involved in polysaccharide export with SLBB domain